MTDILDLSLTDALKALDDKQISSVELTESYIESMDDMDHLNAFVTKTPELAREQARASDERRAKGQAGPLDGIPVAVKDMFCTKDVRTTASSRILEDFVPTYESTVSEKLWENGAVLLGKTSLDEFAMGASNTTSYFGNVMNPWKGKDGKDLVPGGSSGGSAAAVAGRLALAALGTDTNGSIRQPASFCGITGIKPTYGRCSRWGIVAFASSLDQAGVFGRDVKDCAHLLKAVSGYDPKDSTSANKEVPDWPSSFQQDIKGMRIGVPKEFNNDAISDDVRKLWEKGQEWLKEAGAEVIDISLPHAEYAVPAYYIIAPAEASSNLARYDGVRYGLRVDGDNLKETYMKTRAEGFGDEVKRRIMIGTYVLSSGYYDAYYLKAQKVRRLIANDFTSAFEKCDAILAPTSPTAAFPIGERSDDPVQMYLEDMFTSPASLAGLPGMSVPAGLNSNALPLGLQIIGKAWDEETVLRVGHHIETAAQFTAVPSIIQKKAA